MVAAAWIACRLRPVPRAVHSQHDLVARRGRGAASPGAAAGADGGGARRVALRRTAAGRAGPGAVAAPQTAVAPTAVDALSRVPIRVAARVPARVAERLTNPFVPLQRVTDRRGRRSGVAVRLAHAAGSTVGPRCLRALRPSRDRELAAAASGRRRRARARRDRHRGRSPRRRPEPAPHAGRPRLRRHRDATGVRPVASHRAAAGCRVDGADPARAGDDAVPRAGSRPAPGYSPWPGRPPSWSACCSSTPEPGWRRANTRSRAKPPATPTCCSTSARRRATTVGSSSASGSPAARRACRGAVVALDADAPKETRDAERSRTVAARGRGLWLAGALLLPLALPLSLVARQCDVPQPADATGTCGRTAIPARRRRPAAPVPAAASAASGPPAPPHPRGSRRRPPAWAAGSVEVSAGASAGACGSGSAAGIGAGIGADRLGRRPRHRRAASRAPARDDRSAAPATAATAGTWQDAASPAASPAAATGRARVLLGRRQGRHDRPVRGDGTIGLLRILEGRRRRPGGCAATTRDRSSTSASTARRT